MVPYAIEQIAGVIEALGPPSGESRDAYTLADRRLHLALGPNDQIELFLEGARESFGTAAIGRSLEWGEYEDLNTSRSFPALVVRTGTHASQARLLAHLSYEALRLVTEQPGISNSELLTQLYPFLALVLRRKTLDVNQQMGLVAELLLLIELLNFAASQRPRIDSRSALACWTGWDSASRDFAGRGVAVEAKATRREARRHRIRPMYQLLPSAGEHVFVYSVGLRPDRSRDFRMITVIDRVLERLEGDLHPVFLEAVGHYAGVGYDPALRPQYELEPGFLQTQGPALIRVDHVPDILRPDSFVGGEPPSRVQDLEYDVTLDGLPAATAREREQLFLDLLRSPR